MNNESSSIMKVQSNRVEVFEEADAVLESSLKITRSKKDALIQFL